MQEDNILYVKFELHFPASVSPLIVPCVCKAVSGYPYSRLFEEVSDKLKLTADFNSIPKAINLTEHVYMTLKRLSPITASEYEMFTKHFPLNSYDTTKGKRNVKDA